MVSMYNKTANPTEVVPVDKIIEITNHYETEMRSVNAEYENLENELKKEEK